MDIMSVVGGGNGGMVVNMVRKDIAEIMEVPETMKVVEMLSTMRIMKAVESDWLGGDDEGIGDDEHSGAHEVLKMINVVGMIKATEQPVWGGINEHSGSDECGGDYEGAQDDGG